MLHGWDKIGENEERTMLRGIRDNTVYGGPYHVEFSLTDACNYACFFCNSAFVDRSKRLPWPMLERTLNELIDGGLKSIRLCGNGEPLIYPQVEQVLDIIRERNIAISNLTTNGYKLTPGVADRLLAIDTEEIIFSFNDVDPERYASTNGTTERAFNVVLDNIRHLAEERRRRGLTQPNLIMQFMLWKGNHDQIQKAYDIGLELGVDKVYLRDLWGLQEDRRMAEAELHIAQQHVRDLIARDEGVGKLLLNFSQEKILQEALTAPEQQEEHKRRLRHRLFRSEEFTRTEYCYIGWYSTVIRGNGEVFPCCMLAVEPGYQALTNLHDFDSFKAMWEGEAYQALRTELREIAISQGDYDAVTTPCHTRHYCAMADACPFVRSLAHPEFYAAVDKELEPLRKRPNPILNRMRSLLGSST